MFNQKKQQKTHSLIIFSFETKYEEQLGCLPPLRLRLQKDFELFSAEAVATWEAEAFDRSTDVIDRPMICSCSFDCLTSFVQK